jgi:hypothetical protein
MLLAAGALDLEPGIGWVPEARRAEVATFLA